MHLCRCLIEVAAGTQSYGDIATTLSKYSINSSNFNSRIMRLLFECANPASIRMKWASNHFNANEKCKLVGIRIDARTCKHLQTLFKLCKKQLLFAVCFAWTITLSFVNISHRTLQNVPRRKLRRRLLVSCRHFHSFLSQRAVVAYFCSLWPGCFTGYFFHLKRSIYRQTFQQLNRSASLENGGAGSVVVWDLFPSLSAQDGYLCASDVFSKMFWARMHLFIGWFFKHIWMNVVLRRTCLCIYFCKIITRGRVSPKFHRSGFSGSNFIHSALLSWNASTIFSQNVAMDRNAKRRVLCPRFLTAFPFGFEGRSASRV